MLRELSLDYFKCFRALSLPIRPLTLLTGTNASGKSTVLQALLLVHQTAIDARWGSGLVLDGSVISLGTVADVLDQVHGRRSFEIGLRGDAFQIRWQFESDRSDKRDIAVPLLRGTLETSEGTSTFGGADADASLLPAMLRTSAGASELVRFAESLGYIAAERTGPREVYPLGDPSSHRTVGTQGELAPGLLYWFPEERVPELLCLKGPPILPRQTEAWLDRFFPGAGFDVQPVRGANLVTLGLRTSAEEDFHRPQNVGFGLSHVFPIVVAALHARSGDTVIVENPEVHLHPQGQARIGELLSRAAAAGTQVIVETHSDHVLNGVRRSIRDGLVSPTDVAIHFFQPRAVAEQAGGAQVVTPSVDRHGHIDRWPDGFFDQFEKDVGYLAGL